MIPRRSALAALMSMTAFWTVAARAAALSDWAEQIRIAKMFEEGRIPAKSFRDWSSKMTPTLLEGDVVLADLRIAGKTPRRGDVIVRYAKDSNVTFDRVVGLPGERFAMRGGRVFLDRIEAPQQPAGAFRYDSAGRPEVRNLFAETLPDTPAYKIARMETGGGFLDDIAEVAIPEGRLYLLGDNRDNSVDSRSDGPIALDRVIGRVVYRLRPNPGWLAPRDSVPGLPKE